MGPNLGMFSKSHSKTIRQQGVNESGQEGQYKRKPDRNRTILSLEFYIGPNLGMFSKSHF